MTKQELFNQIVAKKSFLCVGLDTDPMLIPRFFMDYPDPMFEFNKQIIDATHDLAIAYKPNIAFYEAEGVQGWKSLQRTIDYLSHKYPECFTIADAKRGDIGNTSKKYAAAFFRQMNFDAVTVAPYMGSDSVLPFLEFENKWVILLGLTSNKGSADFQFLESTGKPLFETVMTKAQQWGSSEQLMFVTGATHPEAFKKLRATAEDYFFLVPGVGAQGGRVEDVCTSGMNASGGLIINSTRQIIYASEGNDFAEKARAAALNTVAEMKPFVAQLLS